MLHNPPAPPPPSLAVTHTAPQPNGFKRARTEDRSDLEYYNLYCPTFSGPHSEIVLRSVTIPFNEMDILSNAVYRQIVQVVYAGNATPTDLIQEADFIGVVKAIFKSKLDHVSSKISGVRPAARLPLARSIRVPRVLADAINVYGSFFANEGVTKYYPIATVAPQGENPPSLTTAHVIAFVDFIESAALRGFISTSLITPAVEGTGAWMLYTSESGGSRSDPAAHADANSLNVQVRAQFRDFTPADAVIAALIVNSRDCVTLHGCTEYPFAGPEITNVPTLRRQLATS